MTRYYIRAPGIGPLRALAFLSTERGWRLTMAAHCARIFGSRSEAKRALLWVHENGYDSARICEETR
jgi:hypothetical protein